MKTTKMSQSNYWEVMLYQDFFQDFKENYRDGEEAHEMAIDYMNESTLQIYSDEFAVLTNFETGTYVFHAKNGKIVYKEEIASDVMADPSDLEGVK